jgi:hypothetical protein
MMRFVQLHHSLTLLFVSSRMKAQSVNPDHHLKVKPTYAEKSSGKSKGVGTVCV